jgi:hypothetical protein
MAADPLKNKKATFIGLHFYPSTLLHLLHQKKLFERKFVLLFDIFLFFNGSAAILPSSESSFERNKFLLEINFSLTLLCLETRH